MAKKAVTALLFSIFCIFPIFSEINENFEEIIDFSITMEDIDAAVSAGREDTLLDGRMIILDGAISAIEIIDPEPETFTAEIELVAGKWLGMSDVQMFSSVVVVSGKEFAARIPVRRRRTPAPDEIQANSHVLVAGKITGFRTFQNGRTAAVLDGFYIRPID